jgi:hypothetical protein
MRYAAGGHVSKLQTRRDLGLYAEGFIPLDG